jgi:hypothetical protein
MPRRRSPHQPDGQHILDRIVHVRVRRHSAARGHRCNAGLPHVAVPAEALHQPDRVGQRACELGHSCPGAAEAAVGDGGPASGVDAAESAAGGEAADARSVGEGAGAAAELVADEAH